MTTQEDKLVKKIIDKFFKCHKQFKEASCYSRPDAALLYKKDNLTFHKIIIFDEANKNPQEYNKDGYDIIYLKNTNPHDSRKASQGYVRRTVKLCK